MMRISRQQTGKSECKLILGEFISDQPLQTVEAEAMCVYTAAACIQVQQFAKTKNSETTASVMGLIQEVATSL